MVNIFIETNTMAIQGPTQTFNGRSTLVMVVKATVSICNLWLLILILAKVELLSVFFYLCL